MKVEGLILAAGLSSRMGRHKLLDRIGGVSVIQRTVMAMLPFCDRVTVVTGHGASMVAHALETWESPAAMAAYGRPDKVHTVFNPNYGLGMFSSFQVGIAAIEMTEQQPLVLMMPGDMPFVQSDSFEAIIHAARDEFAIGFCSAVYTVTYTVYTGEQNEGPKIGSQRLWVPSYQHRAGHPVAFYLNETLRRHILGAHCTETLKAVLEPMARCFVNVSDPGILQDLDTPEDFQRLVVQGGRP